MYMYVYMYVPICDVVVWLWLWLCVWLCVWCVCVCAFVCVIYSGTVLLTALSAELYIHKINTCNIFWHRPPEVSERSAG